MEVSGVVEDKAEETQQEEVLPEEQQQQQLNGKKISWPKLRRYDSLDIESRSVAGLDAHGHASKVSLIPTKNFTYIFPTCMTLLLRTNIILVIIFSARTLKKMTDFLLYDNRIAEY